MTESGEFSDRNGLFGISFRPQNLNFLQITRHLRDDFRANNLFLVVNIIKYATKFAQKRQKKFPQF